MFNSNDLGYKILSGQLRNNRKHSEQVNKYLAGLIDADGSISITFFQYKENYYTRVRFQLVQSFTNDPDGQLIRALRDYYDLGFINYHVHDKWSAQTQWSMGEKQLQILIGRIGKHLKIKGTQARELLYIAKELRRTPLTEEQAQELKEYCKQCRTCSTWLKRPKHPSMAWLAGYLDGDGHYKLRLRERFHKRKKVMYTQSEITMAVTADKMDLHILEFLKEHLKGSVFVSSKNNTCSWKRYLGKTNRTFTLRLMKGLRKYSCLPKKYKVINDIIKFHELVAETKQMQSE